MVAAVYINRQGSDSKNQVRRVSKSLESAKKSIKNANDYLYNVGSSRVRTERESLTSIYKKDNTYESNFDDFASKLESCVNELIQTDKNCATKIKRNGQSHRTANGLPKSLVGAAVNATFTTLGNIVDSAMDDLGKWVYDTMHTIASGAKEIWDKVIDDWDAFIQFAEGIGGLVLAGGVILAAITGTAVGPVMLAAAAVGLFYGFDKTLSGLVDIAGWVDVEDGESLYKLGVKEILPESLHFIVDIVYDAGDAASSVILGGGASAIKDLKVKSNLYDDIIKKLDFGKIKLPEKIFGKDKDIGFNAKDIVPFIKDISEDGIFKATGELVVDKIKDISKIFGINNLEKTGLVRDEDFYKNLSNNLQIDFNRDVELASRKK